MSEGVAVALIAVGGVVLTQFVTYLISRQSASDLRTNIDREIEIIRKLQPGSTEATKLEAHIKASIEKLVYRDQRREQLADVVATFAPLMIVTFAAMGFQSWREHGVPHMLRPTVTVIYWGLFAMSAWLFLRYIWQLAKLMFAYLRVFSRLTFSHVRLLRARLRLWRAQRRLAKGKAHMGALINIAEDLLDTLDENPDPDDKHAQAVRQEAGDRARRQMADLKSKMGKLGD
ncbi:hypothetical protein [Mycolicibacterium sp.]|uniref:hypothetical protein n=1 Tax=Mycolicibacterium sp. TaxID=2320850 RepID=UPI001A34D73A|nr:hypothetical protein [Mycolicibacterium sp.]MBJ7341619.1 hypothetical protein [Mycolicibacterium sp.]